MKSQFGYAAYLAQTLCVIGTSIVFTPTLGVLPHLAYPEVISKSLRDNDGLPVRARNLGLGGDTSSHALYRVASCWKIETPKVLLIDVGVNDPFAVTGTAQGTANTTTAVKLFADGTQLWTDIYKGRTLTIGASSATIKSFDPFTQIAQLNTALGAAPNGSEAWTIAAASPAPIQVNIQAMVTAALAAGVSRVGIVSTHFRNFNGGDFSGGVLTPDSNYASVRSAQAAVATAMNDPRVKYFDVWTPISQQVVAGAGVTYRGDVTAYSAAGAAILPGTAVVLGQADGSMHVAPTDQHLNAVGLQILGDVLYSQLPDDWKSLLA